MGEEMRVSELRLPIVQRSVIVLSDDRAARCGQDCMSRGGVPLHGWAEARIKVGFACGDETKLERRPGGNAVGDVVEPYISL